MTSEDPDEHMPPLKSGKKLTAQQIELIRKWASRAIPGRRRRRYRFAE